MSQQDYAECAALVAVMDADFDEANRILDDFSAAELNLFGAQVDKLFELISQRGETS